MSTELPSQDIPIPLPLSLGDILNVLANPPSRTHLPAPVKLRESYSMPNIPPVPLLPPPQPPKIYSTPNQRMTTYEALCGSIEPIRFQQNLFPADHDSLPPGEQYLVPHHFSHNERQRSRDPACLHLSGQDIALLPAWPSPLLGTANIFLLKRYKSVELALYHEEAFGRGSRLQVDDCRPQPDGLVYLFNRVRRVADYSSDVEFVAFNKKGESASLNSLTSPPIIIRIPTKCVASEYRLIRKRDISDLHGKRSFPKVVRGYVSRTIDKVLKWSGLRAGGDRRQDRPT